MDVTLKLARSAEYSVRSDAILLTTFPSSSRDLFRISECDNCHTHGRSFNNPKFIRPRLENLKIGNDRLIPLP